MKGITSAELCAVPWCCPGLQSSSTARLPWVVIFKTVVTFTASLFIYLLKRNGNCRDLEEALEMGVDWSLREGYAWAEDKEHCEEYGRMLQADPNKVSSRAKKRGLPQVKLCFKRVLSAPRVQSER